MKFSANLKVVLKMSLPVRCFTCGKFIGNKEERYVKMLESGIDRKTVLDTLGMKRYCCRRMFLGYVNIIDQLLLFPQPNEKPCERKIEEIKEL